MEGSRTLILGSENKKEQALLNLKSFGESEIKFFNFSNFQNKNFALGIKQGEGVKKIPLTIKNNLCKFKLPQGVNLQKNLFCAVVDVSNAFCPEIILSGSNNTNVENGFIEETFVVKKPEDSSVLYREDSEEDINNLVEKNLQEDLNSTYFDCCTKCKYRQAFYNEGEENNEKFEELNCVNTQIKNDKNNRELNKDCLKNEEDVNEEQNFYEQVKNQIEALFNKYEQYEELSKVISNSKWVKVNYDNSENFYVLGLIYDETADKVNFISYGVPSSNKDVPPEDLKEFAQWLPLENSNEKFLGFWLVYQNALNGETVSVDYL